MTQTPQAAFTFAPRVRKSAPTAPSGAQQERPSTEDSRQYRRRSEPQADRRADGPADRQRADGRRGDAPRTDTAPRSENSRRADGRRTESRDGRSPAAPWQGADRAERQDRGTAASGPRRERPGTPNGTPNTAPARGGNGRSAIGFGGSGVAGSGYAPDRTREGARPAAGRDGRLERDARPERDSRAPIRRSGPPTAGFSPAPARRPMPAPMPSAPSAGPQPSLESFFADAASLNLNPVESFADLALRPEIRAAVDAMGITVPTPIQANAIPIMLDGRDMVGQAKTGSGKTLAFALPIVERLDPAVRSVQALILVPTRELAIQVGHVIEKLTTARRLKLTLLYGGRSLIPEARALAGGAQIVVGTPGRTLDHLRQRNLSIQNLRMFVLDEGDEMLDRGFAPDVERILAFTPPTRQTALFSATVPPWVMQTAAKHLRTPVLVRVNLNEAPPEIEHIVYDVDANTRSMALRTLLDKRGDGPVIVFGRTKHGVKKLARQLEGEGFPVVALHGNLSQNARERAMVELRAGTLPILVATNVAARGIDIADVGQVINYEVPESAELFTHRVGRTGRMGRSGEAITFVTPDEAPKWRQIERALGKTLPRQPWMVDGQPVPVQANVPSPDADDRDARRPGGDRGRTRWRRGGR